MECIDQFPWIFFSGQAKASYFAHPLIKIVQRFMANILFGRPGSDGQMKVSELLFLEQMLDSTFLCGHLDYNKCVDVDSCFAPLSKVCKQGEQSNCFWRLDNYYD